MHIFRLTELVLRTSRTCLTPMLHDIGFRTCTLNIIHFLSGVQKQLISTMNDIQIMNKWTNDWFPTCKGWLRLFYQFDFFLSISQIDQSNPGLTVSHPFSGWYYPLCSLFYQSPVNDQIKAQNSLTKRVDFYQHLMLSLVLWSRLWFAVWFPSQSNCEAVHDCSHKHHRLTLTFWGRTWWACSS